MIVRNKINMTAFDSPLLISKPVCLHARPAADLRQRSLSVSEQQLITLLERRRRKYLVARKDSGDKYTGDEGDQSVHVIDNLGVADPNTGMHQSQRRQSPVSETVHFRHTIASSEVVSEVMLPTKTRTRAKNLKSKIQKSHQ